MMREFQRNVVTSNFLLRSLNDCVLKTFLLFENSCHISDDQFTVISSSVGSSLFLSPFFFLFFVFFSFFLNYSDFSILFLGSHCLIIDFVFDSTMLVQ